MNKKESILLNFENRKIQLEEIMRFLLPKGIDVDGIEKTIQKINIEIKAIKLLGLEYVSDQKEEG